MTKPKLSNIKINPINDNVYLELLNNYSSSSIYGDIFYINFSNLSNYLEKFAFLSIILITEDASFLPSPLATAE